MTSEPIRLAGEVVDQLLVAGVPPVPLVRRDLQAALTQRQAGRRHDELPAGGLFDDVARNQLEMF